MFTSKLVFGFCDDRYYFDGDYEWSDEYDDMVPKQDEETRKRLEELRRECDEKMSAFLDKIRAMYEVVEIVDPPVKGDEFMNVTLMIHSSTFISFAEFWKKHWGPGNTLPRNDDPPLRFIYQ